MRIQPLPHRRLHPDNHALPGLPAAARAFSLGESGVRLVTLPDAGTALKVMVPRGHGWPMLGVRVGEGLRGALHGEACSSGRWAVAGGVALEVHEVDLPRGPAPTVTPVAESGEGAWLALRLRNLPWSAARLRDPSAGHGLIAVAGARVVGVSPAAREAGVVRGMSLPAARRRCPRVKLVAPAATATLADAVSTWLTGRFPSAVAGRTWLIPVPQHPTTAGAVAQADALARLLWQVFGVECTAAVAGSAAAARAAVGWLGPRQIAAIPADADGAVVVAGVRRVVARGAGRRWRGAPRPDVEGVAEVIRLLSGNIPAGRAVAVHLDTERGPRVVRVRPRSRMAVFEVERAVRGAILGAGAVSCVRVQVGVPTRRPVVVAAVEEVAPLRQLALIPGLR